MCLWASEIGPDDWLDSVSIIAGEILGLNEAEADDLFFGRVIELDTAEKAAAHIRKMVAEDSTN